MNFRSKIVQKIKYQSRQGYITQSESYNYKKKETQFLEKNKRVKSYIWQNLLI